MVLLKRILSECHDILMLGKRPIKWRQRPDMTIAVDWDVNHQFTQTNKQTFWMAPPDDPHQGVEIMLNSFWCCKKIKPDKMSRTSGAKIVSKCITIVSMDVQNLSKNFLGG